MQLDELHSLLLIFAIAASAPLLCEWVPRLRLPLVVVEIGLGIVVGPHVLGWATRGPVIDVLANFGLAFLFFLAGFEVDFRAIRGRPLALAGVGWVVSLAVCLGVGFVLQGTGMVASGLIVGAALTTTALGTLMPILRDAKELPTRFGAYAVAAGAMGEFGPILLIALVLSGGEGEHGGSPWLLVAFTAVILVAVFVTMRFRPPRLILVLQAKMHTSAQLPVRLAGLVLASLVILARELGLDAILGALAAGVLVALASPGEHGEALRHKLEGIGFGFFVPIFFVTTGLRYDLEALLSSRTALLQLPMFLALFLVVRGLPALLVRRDLNLSAQLALALLSATQLPLVVAITEIGVRSGHLKEETAAALVGAGMVSVLLFPFAALALRRMSSLQPAKAPEPVVLDTPEVHMNVARYPMLYQVNTRVWLTELSRRLGRRATLDDIPDAELDSLAELGFDWAWFLSVWQTGAAGQRVSRGNHEWQKDFEETLPDLREEDVAGSGFAITGYTVHPALGGDAALARLRERLRQRGLRLMLDFVPNHMALDHPWVEEHPEYFIPGTELDLARAPQNYTWVKRKKGDLVLAYGRDPYFAGWPDTLQLNYGNPALREAMTGELRRIAGQCDGVRCDMAMLVLPDVFERTWGIRTGPFWPEATRRVREGHPEFCFMAEVYWDREWELQQQGFDYAYDKRLYDRLRERHARPVREHFGAGLDYQDRLARFLENHDEPRAAATFPPGVHEAAAVITFLSPGLRFFHQGQFLGRKKRISPHLIRGPDEPADADLGKFYDRLLAVLRQPAVRQGRWQLLQCVPAWEGNETWDSFVAFSWEGADGMRLLVAVNYSPDQGQCYVRLPFGDLGGGSWRLQDHLGEACYDREGGDLASRGLYLDVRPWQVHVFSLGRLS